MIFDLKQILNITGERLDIDYEFSVDNPVYGQITFDGPIKLTGFFQNRAGIASLNYTASFSVKALCDRCLKEFEMSFESSFEHLLIKFLESNNSDQSDQSDIYGQSDDYIVCDNEKLDLNELSTSDILLSLPTKLLCEEDCKGLCADCGADLNIGTCNCDKVKIDPRFEILKKLL